MEVAGDDRRCEDFDAVCGMQLHTVIRPANLLIGTGGIRCQGNALERKNRAENRAQVRFSGSPGCSSLSDSKDFDGSGPNPAPIPKSSKIWGQGFADLMEENSFAPRLIWADWLVTCVPF